MEIHKYTNAPVKTQNISYKPKVRLANPFPVMGRIRTLPLRLYFPAIDNLFVFPTTSNLDVFISSPKPLYIKRCINFIYKICVFWMDETVQKINTMIELTQFLLY